MQGGEREVEEDGAGVLGWRGKSLIVMPFSPLTPLFIHVIHHYHLLLHVNLKHQVRMENTSLKHHLFHGEEKKTKTKTTTTEGS